MRIQIVNGNILDSTDDAIILTIDGAARGMEGNVTRCFARKYSELWEDMEQEISFPLSLGQVQAVKIPAGWGCPHRFALMASTLHHKDVLFDEEKMKVIKRALSRALSLATQKGCITVAATMLTGGWRVPLLSAFESMIDVFQRFQSVNTIPLNVTIYVINESEYLDIQEYLDQNQSYLGTVGSGVHIESHS